MNSRSINEICSVNSINMKYSLYLLNTIQQFKQLEIYLPLNPLHLGDNFLLYKCLKFDKTT